MKGLVSEGCVAVMVTVARGWCMCRGWGAKSERRAGGAQCAISL